MVAIPAALVADAGVAARAAAERYGLRVVELGTVDQHEEAVAVLCKVWGASPDDLVNTSLLRALAHSGNYVTGAYAGHRMVGAAVAFFGDRHLHSHVTGVDRATQAKGVGYALKQHQRAWTLRRGLTRVCWTFDPLVRRNAHFNLQKLGAFATAYLPDFYGALNDGINTGDASDRLYVSWELDSAPAVSAAAGIAVTAAPLRARVLVDNVDDEPVVNPPAPGAGALLVAVPEDIESLRQRDPKVGARWRGAVRDAMVDALGHGYRIAGMTADRRYVLESVRR
jgi:predicted GNAT superfamily acetyltransferase